MNSAKITPFARFSSRLGSILSAWVYAVGMSLMYIYIENDIPSTAYVAGYTLLAAGIIGDAAIVGHDAVSWPPVRRCSAAGILSAQSDNSFI